MDVSTSHTLTPARIVALTLIAIPAGSTTGIARLVHRRGHFGRKARVALRSVDSVIAGLGGWLTCALVVLTTMPGVPPDDELLAAASVGLPVGLGVYLTWVNRDWSTRTKIIGLAAAVGGASSAGGWDSTPRRDSSL